ncbi:hypothetical protein NDU88_000935, partial [Pleurodeles waltl]
PVPASRGAGRCEVHAAFARATPPPSNTASCDWLVIDNANSSNCRKCETHCIANACFKVDEAVVADQCKE